ncbi:hypothetical protein AX15_005289 [Amanita polypyramis BW_CC]|nr:hypothetical protein AX15_005289 [Amanita polypyramis BW_CC]
MSLFPLLSVADIILLNVFIGILMTTNSLVQLMSCHDRGDDNGVPFSFLSALVNRLSTIELHRHPQHRSINREYPALQVFYHWLEELRRRFTLSPGTTRTIFRLLFPEEDVRRKYGMQEKRLCFHLAQCLGVPNDELLRWSTRDGSGCLGQEVQRVLSTRSNTVNYQDPVGPLSISDVDSLLDELALASEYPAAALHFKTPAPRNRHIVLRHLYCSLSPFDSSYVTQIILKDLRPLLYPLPSSHYSSALTEHNTVSVRPLTIEDAMLTWDPSGQLLRTYRLRPTIDDIVVFEENADVEQGTTGSFIQMPKSKKGRGCSHALSYFKRSRLVWAETKYDGERAQIHLDILPTNGVKITIFSKSKRDSTHDRRAIHETIERAVGVCEKYPTRKIRRIKQNVVLDAEIVACHGEIIDEFWRIQDLLLDMVPKDNGDRHLGVVFFDILVLDSQPLTRLPYSRRRELLESVIEISPGYVFLAERTPIDLLAEPPRGKLQAIFAQSIANFEEGIVLKAEQSSYNDSRLPWVKLKKDYIPGHGDTLDLVVVGATWDKKRGRELRVPPTTYTTFFIGVLTNAEQVDADVALRPHFLVYFIASYGMTREQLENLNFYIDSADPFFYDQFKDSLNYTFTLSVGLPMRPTIIFKDPLLVELVGAGFTKSIEYNYYELRFPRITRVYRATERTWRDSVDLHELQRIASRCTGNDRPLKDVDDWCNNLWGKNASPSTRSRNKRKASMHAWQYRLTTLDGNHNGVAPMTDPPESKEVEIVFPAVHATSSSKDVNVRTVTCQSPIQQPSMERVENDRILSDHFLQDALIWFSKGMDRTSWKKVVPPNRHLHTLESLLVGCGWQPVPSGIRQDVKQGIAIVHNQWWREFVVDIFGKCKHDVGPSQTQVRKPILVIDATKFHPDNDMESNIIFRLD